MNNWWQGADIEKRELLENRRWFEGAEDRLEYFFKTEYNTFKKGEGNPYNVIDQQQKFWRAVGGKIPRIHSGLPRLITKTKTNLLTANGYEVAFDDDKTLARLYDIIEKTNFDELLQQWVSDMSWAGRGLIRIYHEEGDRLPRLETINPENFEILVERKRIYGVKYISRFADKELNEIMILESGKVKVFYELFKIEKSGNEEKKIPLPATDYQDYVSELPFNFLPFELINNTVGNSRFPDSPYGESDYTAVQSRFHMLDALLSHAQLEITNAKAIKFANENIIKRNSDGKGSFDDNETTIEVVGKDMENFDIDKFIKLFQPAIRVGEYDKLISDSYGTILAITAISPTSTGLPGFESIQASDKSQREREKASLRTRQEALNRLRPRQASLFAKLLKYADWLNNAKIGEYDPAITYSEWSVPTLDDKVDTITKAVMGGVMDVATAVDELYPDKTDEERARIVLNVKMEKGVALFPENFINTGEPTPATE